MCFRHASGCSRCIVDSSTSTLTQPQPVRAGNRTTDLAGPGLRFADRPYLPPPQTLYRDGRAKIWPLTLSSFKGGAQALTRGTFPRPFPTHHGGQGRQAKEEGEGEGEGEGEREGEGLGEGEGEGEGEVGSGPRFQILSHVFARCASQKTHGHARIARVSKKCDTNHIPRATAYSTG